jgi:microsomal dipeptidase-like Zn-dependent dipeptidase
LDELNYKEIMLDNKLIRAGIDLGIINLYYEGGSPHGEVLAKSIKSQKLAELWVSEINNAISRAKVRVRADAGNSASTSSTNEPIADQIKKLSELHQAGILTDEEFTKAKQRVIGS